ncbi:MAG: hypothetical protein EHM91_11105 [Planctomycetota bacterium]|nr:MAG: hypothetical protein EHM91_11105 [Planctomycetota bacterium]
MKSKVFLLFVVMAAGCARAPVRSSDADEQQMKDTLEAAEKEPSRWSPAITIPLFPVILVADTSITFTKATYRYIRDLLGGGPEEGLPVPERVEQQAEKIPKN